MRLNLKKIEEITLPLLGEGCLPIIGLLYNKDNISEFELAKKTKKDIKVVRKMLYLLYNHNLVGFNRKKDQDKGWYIYYWTLLPDSIRFVYFKKKREHLAKLKQRLEEEHKELFFICPKNCVRLNFDQAMDFEFHCPECGDLITQDDDKEKISVIEKELSEIEEELARSIKIEEKKLHKSKAKRRKKVVKKKIKKAKKSKMLKKTAKKNKR